MSLGFLRGRGFLFGVSNDGCEARVAMKRLEVGILIYAKVGVD